MTVRILTGANTPVSINPELLGQDFRDLSVATKYGARLDRRYHNLNRGGLNRLIHDYPSHDYAIDFEETAEIFDRVNIATPTCAKILMSRVNDCLIAKINGQLVEILTIKDEPLPDGKAENQAAEKENVGVKADSNGKTANERGPAAEAG